MYIYIYKVSWASTLRLFSQCPMWVFDIDFRGCPFIIPIFPIIIITFVIIFCLWSNPQHQLLGKSMPACHPLPATYCCELPSPGPTCMGKLCTRWHGTYRTCTVLVCSTVGSLMWAISIQQRVRWSPSRWGRLGTGGLHITSHHITDLWTCQVCDHLVFSYFRKILPAY